MPTTAPSRSIESPEQLRAHEDGLVRRALDGLRGYFASLPTPTQAARAARVLRGLTAAAAARGREELMLDHLALVDEDAAVLRRGPGRRGPR